MKLQQQQQQQRPAADRPMRTFESCATTKQTNGRNNTNNDNNDFKLISEPRMSLSVEISSPTTSVELKPKRDTESHPMSSGVADSAAAAAVVDSQQQQQHQEQQEPLRNKLKNIVVGLLAKKKESKMDNLEAMINESALKLLQQKELIFKQASCLQLDQLCKTTKFTRRELKWLYSGWKVACTDGGGVNTDTLGGTDNSYGTSPSPFLSSAYYGIINEQQFQQIYAQFFPYGGDCSFYAKYVFQAMFSETLVQNGGFITFADYAHALSALLRGSIEEKIDFVFRLYDLNQDNVITLDELSRIFFAVYRLLGDNVNQRHDQATYEQQAERLYNKIDQQQSGSITREQFMEYCKRDSTIVDTIQMLEMSICSSA